MKSPASLLLADILSVLWRIVRIRSPWVVPNPVRSTKHTRPPSGLPFCLDSGDRWLTPSSSCWISVVPLKSTCCLSLLQLKPSLGLLNFTETFH